MCLFSANETKFDAEIKSICSVPGWKYFNWLVNRFISDISDDFDGLKGISNKIVNLNKLSDLFEFVPNWANTVQIIQIWDKFSNFSHHYRIHSLFLRTGSIHYSQNSCNPVAEFWDD